MEENQNLNSIQDGIWQFVRGDMTIADFEEWIYSAKTLEGYLGEALYLQVISTKYTDGDSVYKMKQLLAEYAHNVSEHSCKCVQLPNLAVVDMGDESEEVFRSFRVVGKVMDEGFNQKAVFDIKTFILGHGNFIVLILKNIAALF